MLISSSLVLATAIALTDDRRFDTSIRYAGGDYPNHRYLKDLALDDLDGDGDLDAIMPRRGGFASAPAGLTILENRGDGAFGAPINIDIPGTGAFDGLARIVLADLDGDGDKDAAVSRPGAFAMDGDVALFRRNPGLSFTYMTTVSTGGAGSAGIDAADFDGDGDIDLAMAMPGGGFDLEVAILRNLGGFSFTTAHIVGVSGAPNKLASGDIDGDGDVDLVVACRNARVEILSNDGTGAFGVPVTRSTGGSSVFYCDVALGDIDNDGDLDLVAPGLVQSFQNTYRFARNDGSGTFGAFESRPMPAFMGYSSIELVDLDADGWLDVLFGNSAETVNGVWTVGFNDGAGTLTSIPESRRYFGGEGIEAVACADLDGDGALDVLTVGGSSMQLDVFFNPGDAEFHPGTTYDAESAHNDLTVGDLDNDGDLDVVSTAYIGLGRLQVFHNDGAGALTSVQVTTPGAPSGPSLGDLNGDGFLDLAWVQNAPPYEAYAMLNQGDGTFGAPMLHEIRCGGPGDNALFDVNADGHLDHIVVNRLNPYEGMIGVSLGNGDGTFQDDELYFVDTLARGLAGADLNGDGHLDLITTRWTPGSCCADQVTILMGNGDGTFALKIDVDVDFDPWDIVAVDLDGDGDIDLATCNSGGASFTGPQYDDETISVLLNHGDGTFAPRVDYAGSFSPNYLGTQSITAADADHDGDLDLLVANAGSHDVSLYRNHSDGTFAPIERYGTVGSPLEVACVDLTGDGINDLITTAFTTSPDGDERLTVIAGRPLPTVAGDVNGDGAVDFQDLVAVLAAWGACGDPCVADLDGSGTVDFADLLIVLAAWT